MKSLRIIQLLIILALAISSTEARKKKHHSKSKALTANKSAQASLTVNVGGATKKEEKKKPIAPLHKHKKTSKKSKKSAKLAKPKKTRKMNKKSKKVAPRKGKKTAKKGKKGKKTAKKSKSVAKKNKKTAKKKSAKKSKISKAKKHLAKKSPKISEKKLIKQATKGGFDVKKKAKKYTAKVIVPIETLKGKVNLRLDTLKNLAQKAFTAGKNAIAIPFGETDVEIPFKQAAAIIKAGEKKVNEKLDKDFKTYENKKLSTKDEINKMIASMFKKLFSEKKKIDEMKVDQKAKRDMLQRQKALAINQASNSTTFQKVATTTENAGWSVWRYLFGN